MAPQHQPDPFRTYSRGDAERYEAWYYTAAGRRVAAAEQDALAVVLATLPAHRSVLEVGCGSGQFTRWWAAHSMDAIGVDPSPGMLAAAHGADSCQYLLGAGEALPFADASVDVVAFVTALEFVSDPRAALREAARVARSGILLGVLNLASPLGLQRTVEARFRSSVYRAAHFYTPWGLERLLHRALPGRVKGIHWTTALWPWRVPRTVRRLPCGAFIAMAVELAVRPKEQRHA